MRSLLLRLLPLLPLIAVTLSARSAHALPPVNVQALTSALADPSFRVRTQAALTLGKLKVRDPRAVKALVDALRDDNEGVRGVAAGALGKIGEKSSLDALKMASRDASAFVRSQAQKAVVAVNEAPDGAGDPALGTPSTPHPGERPSIYLELTEIAPGKVDAASAKRVNDRVRAALMALPGVSTTAGTDAPHRYFLDGNLTEVLASPPDDGGNVKTTCKAKLVLGTLPERAIKVMATVGASLGGTTDPADLDASKSACLQDLTKQIAEKVATFLETQR